MYSCSPTRHNSGPTTQTTSIEDRIFDNGQNLKFARVPCVRYRPLAQRPRELWGSQGVAVSRPNASSYSTSVCNCCYMYALLHYCQRVSPDIPRIPFSADPCNAILFTLLPFKFFWEQKDTEIVYCRDRRVAQTEQTCLSGLSERMNERQARKSWRLTNSPNVFKTSSKSLRFAKCRLKGSKIKFSFGDSPIFSICLLGVRHV